ncbi:MAG TPA: sigma factor [Armatimonadota bacterium]|jgi:DNA-directed RNA polymerase specialized sigma24 family protein|nr:sigma factor [Armatimonadota bacterium]HPP74474.1 sigma factor [Armatimonadota bacterium]
MGDNQASFDEYARKTIKLKVRPLIGILGFREIDRDDLEQELAVHLIRRLPDYDSRKGTIKTFITMVVDSKIKTIIRLRKLRDRAFDNPDCSLRVHVDQNMPVSQL